jgi:hypothetical protein
MTANINLNILNAIVQRDTEIIGRMELFVVAKLSVGGRTQEYKTRIIKGRKGELEVKDEDVTTDDIVGVAWVNLQNCNVFDGGRNTYEVRLHYQNVDAGVLNIETSVN